MNKLRYALRLWFCFLVTSCPLEAAKPLVSIRVVPNVSVINLESDMKSLTLIARVNTEGVLYRWSLKGPGSLQGDLTSRKISYLPPEQIDESSIEVLVAVTVTSAQGEVSHQKTKFLLMSSASPLPISATEPQTQKPSEVKNILKKADIYFNQTFFIKPPHKNAFELYQDVLRLAPENQHALSQIQAMMDFYRKWGERFKTQKNFTKAKNYYENHQLIARYMIDSFDSQASLEAFQSVQEQLENLGADALHDAQRHTPIPTPTVTPFPTMTPEPISTPILSPTPTASLTVSMVEELLRQGDRYFDKRQYTTPEAENAFDQYKRVLQFVPDNQHARDRIREIARIYKQWGEQNYQQQNYSKATVFYTRYLEVATYLVAFLGEEQFRLEIQKVRERLAAPTPVPAPTAKPFPTPTATPLSVPESALADRLKQLSVKLDRQLADYKALLHDEKQGASRRDEIIRVLENIMKSLTQLEQMYVDSADPAMLQRVQQVISARKKFEQEYVKRTQ